MAAARSHSSPADVRGLPIAVNHAVAAFPKLSKLIAYLDGLSGRAELAVLDVMLHDADISIDDLRPAITFGGRGYRRNTICRSEHYELLALCWRSGHCTPIHDHRGVSCAFRVIIGEGTEIRFSMSASGLVIPQQATTMRPGYVCSADEPDIHQVVNAQAEGQDLVTMHIYSPPIDRMNTFRPTEPGERLAVYGADDELVMI